MPKKSAVIFGTIFLLLALALLGFVTELPKKGPLKLPILLDMVHHPPGAPKHQTKYNDPEVLANLGYSGKVYMLFESAQLAVNWDSVDPDIIPEGSDAQTWIENKADEVHGRLREAKAAGLKTYCQSDLILFPRRLIKKYGMQDTFGDINQPDTQKYLRLLIRLMFEQFPELDGLVVRIGETYLDDAPYHEGSIVNKESADKTIIPLMKLLREEICERLGKRLIFRTWMSFDEDSSKYLTVSNAIEPHENLLISVKHTEGDFHRGQRFSRVLGMGRHKQIVEVECALNAEGKGAYPNYIGDGLLNGFEEYDYSMEPGEIDDLNELHQQSDLFAGIWTWSRASGWEGPYLNNELWPDLNVYVLSQWALDTDRSEKELFEEFASERLGLQGENIDRFRKICELSAKAILRGKRSSRSYLGAWWSRDEYIAFPKLPEDPDKISFILDDQDEAVRFWEETVRIAESLQAPDLEDQKYIEVSSRYGLYLYRIYRAVVNLAALGLDGDQEEIKFWVKEWDDTWLAWRKLKKENPSCADLYQEKIAKRWMGTEKPIPAGVLVDRFRKQLNK